ncbi:ribosomal protein L6, alpha-beta domain-containing protein [Flagelloscypha sp. PMI_526]|nr:ribosomal protein L6, alpha-beta domain-containing protein [Flagelloscypha sp. PMI_526]
MQAFGRRCFSSTSRIHAGRTHVSHIGASPIPFPPNVTLEPTATHMLVKGPLGDASIPLPPYMSATFPPLKENQIRQNLHAVCALSVQDAQVKEQRAMWGTTRTLIANAITGMTDGFALNLYLVGVGFRAAIEKDPRGIADGSSGSRLNMKLGYSHSVFLPIPPNIKAEVPMPTKISLFSTDKQKLGLFAALVKSYRKPEPYKGKGIFIGNETIGIKKVRKK